MPSVDTFSAKFAAKRGLMAMRYRGSAAWQGIPDVVMRAARATMAAALLAMGSGAVRAEVRDAGSAITLDRSQPAQARGTETLHRVHVDRRRFEATAVAGHSLELPGTGAAVQLARFERSERHGSDWSWIGKVPTTLGEQSVVVTFGVDAVFGWIPQPSGPSLRLETTAQGVQLIEGVPRLEMQRGRADDVVIPKPTPMAKDGLAVESSSPPATLRPTVAPGTAINATAAPPVVDVLMLYTPGLVTRNGSVAATLTQLTHFEAVANQAYVDSAANIRVRVVAKQLINYSAATDSHGFLDFITFRSSDPIKAQIDAWRLQYKADLVAAFRDSPTATYCGVGWLNGWAGNGDKFQAELGYSIIEGGCSDYVFAHESGHTLGLNHDIEQTQGEIGAYPYSRGYRKTISPGSGFATIMAYQQAGDTKVLQFSDPLHTNCLAQPCGQAESADNVRSLGNAAPIVAAFDGVAYTPILVADYPTVTEGNTGTSTLTYHLSLRDRDSAVVAAPTDISFDVHTQDLTAVAGTDYQAIAPMRVTIPAGATGINVPVTVNGDMLGEENETLCLHVSAPLGAWINTNCKTGMILDDEPTITVMDSSVVEGQSGTTQIDYWIYLSSTATVPITFDIATQNDTATAGSDYVASTVAGAVIPAGQYAMAFSVTVNGDTAIEPNETLKVLVANANGARISDGIGVLTIRNDDGVTLSIADASAFEGNTGSRYMTFTASLSQPAAVPVTFSVVTSDDVAQAGSDYQATTLTNLTIPAGQLSRTFQVLLYGDTVYESDEAFWVKVTSATGATILDGQAAGEIRDDEGPMLTLGDVTVTEGNAGTRLLEFTARLTTAASEQVYFYASTRDGNAKSGTDYQPLSYAYFTIPAGSLARTFQVTINGDTAVEANEVFYVDLSFPGYARLLDGTASALIFNDDGPTLSVGDLATHEGNSGTKQVVYTIKLSQAAAGPVTYNVATANGPGSTGAQAGTDYVARTLTSETIPAGMLSKTFAVTLNGDTTVEPNELVYVNLSNATGASILDAQANVFVVNDDGPTLSIGDAAIAEGNSGTKTLTFTISLSQAATVPVFFNLATSNGSATAGSDYVAATATGQSIAAGMLSKTFSVTINGDANIEANEQFVVTITGSSGATIADASAIGTISNDD